MTDKTGYEKAVTDAAEVQILEGHQNIQNDLQVIDQHNVDEAKRESGLKNVGHYLNGQEYDLNRITAEIKGHSIAVAMSMIEMGRKLTAVREVEGYGFFKEWVETNLDLDIRMAQYYMHYAREVSARPGLKAMGQGGITKAAALLGLPDDYKDEADKDGTINGRPVSEYTGMTRKELMAEISRLKKIKDDSIEKNVAEETKGLKAERDALQRKCDELKKFAPVEDPTPEWALSQITELTKATLLVVSLAEQFLGDEKIKVDRVTRHKVEGSINLARSAFDDFYREWIDNFTPEI